MCADMEYLGSAALIITAICSIRYQFVHTRRLPDEKTKTIEISYYLARLAMRPSQT
jgi:hypothetical protein